MALRRTRVHRFCTAVVTFVLTTMLGLLMLSAPAAARVSIVPGAVQGGGTETFAVRLANERKDTSSNRLELVFPKDVPLSSVKVAPAPGWRVSIKRRLLERPVEEDGKGVREVVASIGWTGSRVGPGQFAQFLVTIGSLPRNGLLRFGVVQGYTNGDVDTWIGTSAVGGRNRPGPVITIGSGRAAAPSASPSRATRADATDRSGSPGRARSVQEHEGRTGGGAVRLLGLLGGLAIAIPAVWYARSRSGRRPHPGRTNTPDEPNHADEPGHADEPNHADEPGQREDAEKPAVTDVSIR